MAEVLSQLCMISRAELPELLGMKLDFRKKTRVSLSTPVVYLDNLCDAESKRHAYLSQFISKTFLETRMTLGGSILRRTLELGVSKIM